MDKISFSIFEHIMSQNITRYNSCIESEFCIDNSTIYQNSCLGKMTNRTTKQVVFWYGLTPDGSQAHDFDSFEEFANAKVFWGNKSLKEVWSSVSFLSLLHFSGNGRASDLIHD